MEFQGNYNTWRSTCAQVLACLAFNCLSINLGMIVSMPVIVIGALRVGNDPSLHFSEEQASWFAGLVFMVQPLGSFVSGMLQDLLGRKLCMMMVNIPQLLAWILIYNANSVTLLFVANVIMGISIGFMEAPVLSYIGEISEPRLRGVLSTVGGIMLNLGMGLQMLLGALVDWRTMVLIDSAGPIIAFTALALVPDSPAWQVSKGKVKEAQKTFQWLRGWVKPQIVQQELDALVNYVQKGNNNTRIVGTKEYSAVAVGEGGAINSGLPDPPESQLKIFLHPSVQRPLRLIIAYFFIGNCASLTAIRPYTIEFIDKLNLPIDTHWILVISTCLTLLGALTSTVLMRRVGKRGLTFISLPLSVFCCFGLGVYLALGIHLPWIPLTLFAISFYSVPLGIIFVPWFLLTELFPLRGRGFATGFAGAMGYMIMFMVIKTYYNITSLLNVSGACILYGVIGLLGFVYLYFNLPETEGIPLEDIEKLFADQPQRVRGEHGEDLTTINCSENRESQQESIITP